MFGVREPSADNRHVRDIRPQPGVPLVRPVAHVLGTTEQLPEVVYPRLGAPMGPDVVVRLERREIEGGQRRDTGGGPTEVEHVGVYKNPSSDVSKGGPPLPTRVLVHTTVDGRTIPGCLVVPNAVGFRQVGLAEHNRDPAVRSPSQRPEVE